MPRSPTIIASIVCACFVSAYCESVESYESGDSGEFVDSVESRFEKPTDEIPDFQRHVAPLLGRLGCNGRACHGSFQGRGGFRLSLFGYDFESDHRALLDGGQRVDVDKPRESLILTKPTDADAHDGGLRYERDSWQYNLLKNWIQSGAEPAPVDQHLIQLNVVPSEVLFNSDQTRELKVIAHWSDGFKEDVTPLCRFQTNDPQIASVTPQGRVSSSSPGDTHVVVLYDNAVAAIPVIHPLKTSSVADYPTPTRIDRLVKQKLDKLGIQPSNLTDDASFLRRVSLDVTGTLPSPDEIRGFLADHDPEKRQKKIDELLQSPAYAAWWTTFFCDLTGNNTQQLRDVSLNVNRASQQWYDWIHRRVKDNVPYDQMIEGIILATSRLPEESYLEYCQRMSKLFHKDGAGFEDNHSMPYYWMRRDFRNGETRAINFAHAFMGVRIQCAQCHKHPFDQWSQHDFKQFSRFFTGVSTRRPQQRSGAEKQEMQQIYEDLGLDPQKTRGGELQRKLVAALSKGQTVPFSELNVSKPRNQQRNRNKGKRNKQQRNRFYTDAILLGSETVDLTEFNDVRQPVMNWLRQPDNPYFARAIVNRIWARYFGVGIVDPPDDLNLANPPSNGPLLDYLTEEFVNNHYDLKWLHREIVSSRAYQLSWEPNETNQNDRRNFSRALSRRLPAEVVYDAIKQSTANQDTNRRYRQTMTDRAIAIPGTHLYRNRKNRDSAFALRIFGKSNRSNSCDCDRSDDTSLIQTVYLQNDREIHRLLSESSGWIAELNTRLHGNALSEKEKRQLVQMENRLRILNASQRRAAEQDDQERSKKLKQQIRNLNKVVRPLRKRRDAAPPAEDITIDYYQLVEEAYLRTLSRFPTETETLRCLKHFDEEDDLINSLTGLVWALINTKEFVVNH